MRCGSGSISWMCGGEWLTFILACVACIWKDELGFYPLYFWTTSCQMAYLSPKHWSANQKFHCLKALRHCPNFLSQILGWRANMRTSSELRWVLQHPLHFCDSVSMMKILSSLWTSVKSKRTPEKLLYREYFYKFICIQVLTILYYTTILHFWTTCQMAYLSPKHWSAKQKFESTLVLFWLPFSSPRLKGQHENLIWTKVSLVTSTRFLTFQFLWWVYLAHFEPMWKVNELLRN